MIFQSCKFNKSQSGKKESSLIILFFNPLQSNPNAMYIFEIPYQSALWLKHPVALASALKEVL